MKFRSLPLPLTAMVVVAATLVQAQAQDDAAPAPNPESAAKPIVRMKTSLGDIVLELDRAKAPVTVENFLKYVEDKFYDGTVFHRVIDGFMIQGGGFAKSGEEVAEKETRSPIKNEANNGLKNARGTIAMARTSAPDSATAQFFINVADNPRLDHPSFDGYGYAVFGRVIEGMDVVDKIKMADTGTRNLKSRAPSGQLIAVPMRDVPADDIVIESAVVGAAPAEEKPAEDAAPPAEGEPGSDDQPEDGATEAESASGQ